MNITDFYPFIVIKQSNGWAQYECNNLSPSDLMVLHGLIDRVKRTGMVAVEIGSWTGMSTCCLGDVVGSQSGGILYAIDNFQGSPGSVQTDYKDTGVRKILEGNLKKFKIRRVKILEGNSDSFTPLFEDGTVDFIFIDADHRYTQFKKDLDNWYPKVRPGGLLCGHDFNGVTWDERYIEDDFVEGKHHGIIKALTEKFSTEGDLRVFKHKETDKIFSSLWYVEKKDRQ